MERNLRKKRNYTLEEIAEHCHPKSLWIIINKKVYDVTEFQSMGPSAVELLLEFAAGTNAIQKFLDLHEHSDIAREIMERCPYIGDVFDSDGQSDTNLDSTDTRSNSGAGPSSNQPFTSKKASNTSLSGSVDSSDEKKLQPNEEQSDNLSRSNSSAGTSSDEASTSEKATNTGYQSDEDLVEEMFTRLRNYKAHEASVQNKKVSSCERKQDNDWNALVFTFSLLALGTILFYRFNRS